jgi:hypothetical protein
MVRSWHEMKISAELSILELQRTLCRIRDLRPNWTLRPTYEVGTHDLEGSARGFKIALLRRWSDHALFVAVHVRSEFETICSEVYTKAPHEEWRPDKERADLLSTFIDECAMEAAVQGNRIQEKQREAAQVQRKKAKEDFFSN